MKWISVYLDGKVFTVLRKLVHSKKFDDELKYYIIHKDKEFIIDSKYSDIHKECLCHIHDLYMTIESEDEI